MPTSDRILFLLHGRRRRARTISRVVGKGISHVHKILAGLEDRGLVERVNGDGPADRWQLAEGVEIDYRPRGADTGEVIVQRDGRDPREDGEDEPGRCKAITTSGDRCQNNATGDYCGVHA